MADQCRATKPAAPNDKKIYQCQRAFGHSGQHSSGKYYRWSSEYHKERKG